jgi:hypothetical protein
MISRLVLDAFRRLADSPATVEANPKEQAVLDIAAKAAAEAKGGGPPSDKQTSRLLNALADLDSAIRVMRESAKVDPVIRERLAKTLSGVIGEIARGKKGGASVAVASSDARHLVNYCRMLLSKALAGEDRGTKSKGFNESLRGFAGRKDDRKTLGVDMVAFVRETFSGELPMLVKKYLTTPPKGSGGTTRGSLLAQEAGGPDAARKQAESQVLALLYESIARRVDHVRAGTYDFGANDEASFASVASNLWTDIHYNKIDDQFARPKTGLETPQAKWRRYVEPLRGTDMFAAERPNLGAILDWVNANFHRKDIESQRPVTVSLPGGGSVTAPSFKRRLTADDLRRWYTASQGISSIDAPVSAEGDGGTVGELLGKRDEDFEDTEEYKTQYLSDLENNARIRRRLLAAIHEAAVTAKVDSADMRKVYEAVLLVKLGFASKPAAKEEFKRAWREGGGDIVGEGGEALMRGLKAPRIPFRTEPIGEKLWRDLGRPLRKGWENDKDQGPHRRYRKPWTQKVLVRKDTGEVPKDIRDLSKDPDSSHWKIVSVKHTTAEEPKPEHFMNWVPYTEKDRDADIEETLDAYDGDKWFRMSLRPAAQEALLKSLKEGHPLKKFDPADVFSAYAKNVDAPMWRAMGQVRFSVQRHTNSLYPVLSGPGHDVKSVMQRLYEMLKEDKDPDAPWVFTYIALKRLGKVSHSLRSRSGVNMESLVRSVVSALSSAMAG